MYRSNYKSIFRCHTLEECLSYGLNKDTTKVDLFLYVLDTTDILLNHADGSMIFDADDDIPYMRLANKLEQYIFLHWHALLERIPGQLNGWCEGMLLYTCISMCRWLASKPGCTVVPSAMRIWMKENRLRTHASFDAAQWSVSELLYALDALEHRWTEIRPVDEMLLQYLDILEYRAAWFVMHAAPQRLIDIKKYRLKIDEDTYQIHPMLIYELRSFLWGAPCVLSIYDVGVSPSSDAAGDALGRLCGEGKPPFDDSKVSRLCGAARVGKHHSIDGQCAVFVPRAWVARVQLPVFGGKSSARAFGVPVEHCGVR